MLLHDLIDDPRMSIAIHGSIALLTLWWVFAFCRRQAFGTIGLPFGYLCLLTLIHLGAFIYLLPWYDPDTDPYLKSQGVNFNEVAAGYALTVLGIVGFATGVYLCDNLLHVQRTPKQLHTRTITKFGRQLIVTGAVCFFVIFPISGRIPSGSAIASSGVNLTVVGLSVLAFNSLHHTAGAQLRVVAAALSIPSVTMLFLGFVGYGVSAVIQIGAYVSSFLRLRLWHLPIAVVVFWLALSFYVTYMRSRDTIREVVWRGATFTERVEVVYDRFKEAQAFDPFNTKHLHAVDGRLNQNMLVGRSVEYLRTTQKEHAYGQSLYIAAVAWIPRLLWPGKPSFGGSGELVSNYTGIQFSAQTSVGVGQILEFYINFGQTGVFVGCAFLAIFIRYLDRRASAHLQGAEYFEYARYHLIGICALQPGGMLAEVVASSAAAWVLMYVTKQYFRNRLPMKTAPSTQLGGASYR